MAGWPQLNPATDASTWAVLHLASQMLGKLRIANAPWTNHGWHATLHPRSYGLEIAPTPADKQSFTLALDLCRHAITLVVSDGRREEVPLSARSVADLYAELVAMLERHGLPNSFNGHPNEIADAVPFAQDRTPRAYDPQVGRRLLGVMTSIVPVFERFRAGFSGKASPVHFFWGSFDLAVTRFSGRTAPPHPGGVPGLPDRVTREAYSHEVSSAGFWPGGVTGADPIFYSYAYPEPHGFRLAAVEPASAKFDTKLGEFVLPYAEVQAAADPAAELTAFLQSTYDAAADLGRWNRAALERDPVAP